MWALLRTATSVEDTSAVLDSLAARLASAQPAVQPPDSRALQAVLAALRNEATSAAAARVLQILCQQHASLLIRGGTMAPLCEAAASANGTVQTCAVSCLAALARSSAAKSLSLPETCLPTLLAALRPSSSLACRAAAADAAVALIEGDTGATAQAVRFGVVPSLADLLESAATADRPSAAEAEALAGATLGLVRAVAQLSVGRARLRSCDNAAVLDHVVALLLTPSLSASAAHTCRALCQSGGAPFARRLLLAPSLPAALPLLLTSADAPVRAVLLALTAPLLAAPTAADAIMAPEGDAGSAQGSALGGAGAGSEAAAAASWRALRTTARDVLSRAEASRCPEHRAACVALRATLAVAEAHGAGGAAQQHRSALGAALGAYTGAPAPTKAAAGVAGAAPTASAEALSAPVTPPFDLVSEASVVSGASVVSEASVVIGRAGGARVPLGSLSALEGARPRRLQGRLEVNQSPNLALEDPRGAVASALKRGAKGGADARGGGESGGGGGESGGGSEGHGLVLDSSFTARSQLEHDSSLHEALRLADAQLAQLDRALNTARGALQAQQSAAKAAERRHGLETSLLASALRHAEGMVATAAAEAARAQEDAQARREAAESERTRAEAALAAAARADRQAAQANAARAEAELAQEEAHRARQAAMQTVHEQCEIARTAAYAEATDRHYRQSEAAKQAAVSLAVRRAVAKAVGAAEQAAREQLMRAHEVANAEAAAQAQAAVEAAVEEATARARASHEAALSAALAAEREDHRCAFTAEREDHARQMHVLRAAHASAQEAASAAARDVASARAEAAEARREAAAAKERMVEAARTSEEATRAATAAAGTREAEASAYLKESRDQVRLMTF